MKRKNRTTETLSLSFLDAVTCGFGAIILLLVIAKMFEPIRLEESATELKDLTSRYEAEINQIVGDVDRVEAEKEKMESSVSQNQIKIEDLQDTLAGIRAQLLQSKDDAQISSELQGRLALAKESLTEEMKRLLANYRPPLDEYKVGGIPVDSEYIIFIIDTSGSMRQYAWNRVQQQIRETLEVYPTVKGIQVINDEGTYMFVSTRHDWMEDTPENRALILDKLKSWDAYSNSSPREGIIEAIRSYYDPDKRVSLYVYSDDFMQGSIDAVVKEVDRLNHASTGERRVRIHAVAFPTYYEHMDGRLYSAAYFAILMRELCLRNGGTFVALPSRRDM